MVAKKTKQQPLALDRLFDDFFSAARETLSALERRYEVDGVYAQVFGDNYDEGAERARLRSSYPWRTLEAAYNYAVNGLLPGVEFDEPSSLVVDASDVLHLASSENHSPSAEWRNIIAMADGRWGLDEGEPIHLFKVALLANVDVRTVRNAISAGELASFKSDFDGELWIENASARRWLHGRKGFKPTATDALANTVVLDKVSTPAEFGALLVARRASLDSDVMKFKTPEAFVALGGAALGELESGVFNLPLSDAFAIADHYLLDRKQFLKCVMRVFFADELRMLND